MSAGFIVSIFSPAGAQGTTFMACQLAFMMREFGQTGLVDLNRDFGVLALYLNSPLSLAPAQGQANCQPLTKEDLEAVAEGLQTLYSCAWKYGDAFFVIGAPPAAVEIDAMGSDYVETIVEACRNEFYCTILDLPHTLAAPEIKTALKLSDLIVVVGDFATADSLCKFARLARSEELADIEPKAVYVLNHVWMPHIFTGPLNLWRAFLAMSHGRAKLGKQQIEILHELPYDRKSVRYFINHGQMLPKDLPLAQELAKLADKIRKRLV